ncbi:MAG: phosphoribosylpyrophosphate synthetase [Deltaproteobacteria bacterium CG11_big_fil_rev_8_21_14_0_20_47_16]|nr:MAG: phosphoribosylpyrophosphate synthetase [Deltaproteobacteria bacterium CG11_big_fil_rev_8_21_14_0_20_47_16]
MPAANHIKVFSGNSNRPLAEAICKSLSIPLSKAEVKRFSDGETWVEIGENVRGQDVFVIQPTSQPANENLMELLIMIDALKRASAERITAVIPYYGYARQERKVQPRTPITAKLVADLVTATGANRVLACDLHAGQIQGFFNIPVDHLYAAPVLLDYVKTMPTDDMVIVSPDVGGAERARMFASKLHVPLALVDKRRPAPNKAEISNVIGDVSGKVAVVVDDMIDTAGTLCKVVDALIDHGAKEVRAVATHGVLSGPAVQRIKESKLKEMVVTDTIQTRADVAACDKIKVKSVAELLAEAIRRIHNADSVSSLFV